MLVFKLGLDLKSYDFQTAKETSQIITSFALKRSEQKFIFSKLFYKLNLNLLAMWIGQSFHGEKKSFINVANNEV